MTKVSRIPVAKEDWSRFLDDFYSAVTSLEDKKEIKEFLKGILSRTEETMLAKRFQIVMMLLLGHDYNAIKNKVKVTDSTIAKINNLLNDERGMYLARIAERIIDLKKKKLASLRRKPSKEPKTLGGALVKAGVKTGADLLATKIVQRKKKRSITS